MSEGIDWAATGQMLSGVGTIGSAFAILLAGLLGRQAAANFRRQKQAEREIEHAEKALAAAYKIESALSTIRSPLTTGSESSESSAELDEFEWFKMLSDNEKSKKTQSNVFYRRIRYFQDDFDSAIAVLPFVKAYFGNEADRALRDLIHCRHTIRVYADAYARDRMHDHDYSLKIESFIWEGAEVEDGMDPIGKRVRLDLKALEAVLLPVIRSSNEKRIGNTESTEQIA